MNTVLLGNTKGYVGEQKKAFQTAPLSAHKSCKPESGKHSEFQLSVVRGGGQSIFYLQTHSEYLFLEWKRVLLRENPKCCGANDGVYLQDRVCKKHGDVFWWFLQLIDSSQEGFFYMFAFAEAG